MKTNKNPAPVAELIPCAFLSNILLFLYFTVAATPILAEQPVESSCNQQIHAIYNINQGTLGLPHAIVDENKDIQYKAQFDTLPTQNPFHFQLTALVKTKQLQDLPVGTYSTSKQLLTLDSLCLQSKQGDRTGYHLELQAIPNSQPLQFLLKSATDANGNSLFNWQLNPKHGDVLIADGRAFDDMATSDSFTGNNNVREVKFVIADLDGKHPILYFMNSTAIPLHYDFLRDILKRFQNLNYEQGNTQFTAETYFREDRRYLAGSVVAYDNYNNPEDSSEKTLYTLEFWPTDPVPAELIEQAYRTISAAMPFLTTSLAYHPAGNTHEREYLAYADQFVSKNIRVIHSDNLFTDISSAILNKGEAYGRLRIIKPGDTNPDETNIAIYTYIPNTLGHVGGIITEQPQTPLSHINLKARQNNTPNAYIKNASTNKEISALINQWVHYYVSDHGVHIEASNEAEALQWLADNIPDQISIPEGDLEITEPMPLTALAHKDWKSVGVKAANVAELGKILTTGIAPVGYALPFAMYDEFMHLPRCADNVKVLCDDKNSQSLYEIIEQGLNDDEFINNKPIREQRLARLRSIIEQAEAPQTLIERIETVRLFWEPAGEPFSQKLRVRSSTNNEDLKGFNGAGLYDSYTHKPKEGKLVNSIKQVWASLWSDRAFEERRLHRIDHLKTYMGVLIHPNYGDEQANGVAITKNIYNPKWEGFYLNAQYGEISITNPEPVNTENGLLTPVPDEFIMTRLPASTSGLAWETLFIRHSNIETVYDEPVNTENVLTETEMDYLRENLQIIHKHFKSIYLGGDDFALDIEFKITETSDGSRGNLAIKQARPWID